MEITAHSHPESALLGICSDSDTEHRELACLTRFVLAALEKGAYQVVQCGYVTGLGRRREHLGQQIETVELPLELPAHSTRNLHLCSQCCLAFDRTHAAVLKQVFIFQVASCRWQCTWGRKLSLGAAAPRHPLQPQTCICF